MSSSTISAAVQDYLKHLCLLEGEADVDADAEPAAGTDPGGVSPGALAARMGVSAASTTNMLKKLDAMGLVAHPRYGGARLTPAGRKIALEVIRHHRLLETYLAEALGVPWDAVHAEAEVLEHVLSEDLEDRIAARLGHPTQDPHGHPIPAKDGSMPPATDRVLWDVRAGAGACIARVSDEHPEALRYLATIGIRPGAQVTVEGHGPVGGPVFVRVGSDDDVHALSKEVAESVWVA